MELRPRLINCKCQKTEKVPIYHRRRLNGNHSIGDDLLKNIEGLVHFERRRESASVTNRHILASYSQTANAAMH